MITQCPLDGKILSRYLWVCEYTQVYVYNYYNRIITLLSISTYHLTPNLLQFFWLVTEEALEKTLCKYRVAHLSVFCTYLGLKSGNRKFIHNNSRRKNVSPRREVKSNCYENTEAQSGQMTWPKSYNFAVSRWKVTPFPESPRKC